MQVREEQASEAAKAIAAHLFEHGLAKTSLRQLAAAAGVSDRMLVYYFGSKAEALRAGALHLAQSFAMELSTADRIPEKASFEELLPVLGGLFSDETVAPFMRLWIDVISAAGHGVEPYPDIVKAISSFFVSWIEARLSTADPEQRADEAAALMVIIDGIALLSEAADEGVSERAAGFLIKRLSGPM